MGTHAKRIVAAVALAALLTGLVAAPRATPAAATETVPPFSAVPPNPPGAPICTPTLMDSESFDPGAANVQNWYAKTDASGTLRLAVSAVSVNPVEESGGISASVYAAGGALLASTNVAAPTGAVAPGSAATVPLTITYGAADDPLRIQIALLDPSVPNTRPARHYRLRLDGARLIGTLSPGIRNFEGELGRWLFAVANGEDLGIAIGPGNVAPATTADLRLRAPGGFLAQSQPSATLPATVTVSAAAAGAWNLAVSANGHYVLSKPTGADRGIYANWRTGGRGSLGVDVRLNGSPFAGTATLQLSQLFALAPPEPSGPPTPVTGGHALLPELLPGVYRAAVTIDGLPTQTRDVVLTCASHPVLAFDFVDVAPAVTITAPASGAIFAVNTAIVLSGSFSDPDGAAPHAATWTAGTTVLAGTVSESPGAVTATTSIATPGIYPISLAVTDRYGVTGSTSTVGDLPAYVVIYDPEGGFVTGGGWITSPKGAYTPDPAATGRATFGLVSKYLPGRTTPSGETEFQFRTVSFNFHSTDYEWLVVSGARAQYKGTGTINAAGSYQFLLTAIDGNLTGGGGSDRFRIKIWSSGGLIYDNQMNDPDSADPTTTLGGGSIVIHR